MINRKNEAKRNELIKAINLMKELLEINVVKENEYWRARLTNTVNQMIQSLGAMLAQEELGKAKKR